MKLPVFLLHREMAAPVLTLVGASAVSVALLSAKILLSGQWSHGYLIWNLFLAWLPLLLALLVCHRYETSADRGWKFLALCSGWLLFFPNAPYIVTDLIHLWSRHGRHFWIDLVLVVLFAWIGLILGCLSLWLMQRIVSRVFGGLAGWLFVAASAGLCGLGVYLGRFLRWNSWDAVLNPLDLLGDIVQPMTNPLAHRHDALFIAVFGLFVFLAYSTVYSLIHFRVKIESSASREASNRDDAGRVPCEINQTLRTSECIPTKAGTDLA
ncbi:MAG: DUF1361 domain-containing protein [Opitutaceae bacterium]|nr:DUF1361 domain-containing protein [Verrucomicrobiales bacterium]